MNVGAGAAALNQHKNDAGVTGKRHIVTTVKDSNIPIKKPALLEAAL